jgi:tRNA pseudouridine38-40 synthase
MIVNAFYIAWCNQDIETIQSLIDDSLFGIRTYKEIVLFSKQDLLDYIKKNPIKQVQFKDITETPNGWLYELEIDGVDVSAKMRINNQTISKLYETKKTDSTRIRFVCSYDGSAFYGYQKQQNQRTIQGTIERALQEALSLDSTPSIHSSGRTDKGVHANMQVFHTDVNTVIPIDKVPGLLNSYLPDSIFIKEASIVPQTFHSRYDIIEKEYLYVINHKEYNPIQRQYEWFVPHVNGYLLEKELKTIIGTHDFQSFTKTTTDSTIRTITDVQITNSPSHIYIHIKGHGFLRYMVRYIVGAAVAISTGSVYFTMTDLLAQKDVSVLKDMAPPNGLYLHSVKYE